MKMHNPPHVGEFINETLMESNLDIATFANMLNTEVSFVQLLINGQINVDVQIAEKLSRLLGSSPKFWLNIQNNHMKNFIV